MPALRALAVQRSALELDGVPAGLLNSVEGGGAAGEVVVEPPSIPGVQGKHLGAVHYQDIAMTCGAGMSVAFWELLQSALRGEATSVSGAIVGYDQSLTERRRMEFKNALITEITFPKLDAAAKEAALLTVRLAPESTRRVKAGNAKLPAPPAARQKAFTQANFRLAVDGLPDAAKTVSKVDALTVGIQATSLEVPNLVVSLAQSAAEPFEIWHEDFVIAGNQKQRSATLDLLAPDLKQVLLSLQLSGLGIFRLAYDRIDAATEKIAGVTASMYCEQIALATVPGTP
jgi:hypothetical protein